MDTVGIRRDRDVRVVVDDEKRAVKLGEAPERPGDGILLTLGHRLLAELDDARPAFEGGLHDACRLHLATLVTRDQVEAHS